MMSSQASAALPIRNAEMSTVVPDFLSFGNEEFINSSHHQPDQATTTVLKYTDRVGESLLKPSVDNKEAVAAVLKSDKNTIPVLISGQSFLVDKRIFAKLQDLPWSIAGETFTLNAAPELFEFILNHLLFKTMPEAKLLSPHDKEELVALAKLLNLSELINHITSRSSFFRRSSSGVKARGGDAPKGQEKAAPPAVVNTKNNAQLKITTAASEDTAPTTEEGSSGTVSPLQSPVTTDHKNSPRATKPPKKNDNNNTDNNQRATVRSSFKRAFSLRGSMTKRNSSKTSVRSSGSQHGSLAEEEWYADVVA